MALLPVRRTSQSKSKSGRARFLDPPKRIENRQNTRPFKSPYWSFSYGMFEGRERDGANEWKHCGEKGQVQFIGRCGSCGEAGAGSPAAREAEEKDSARTWPGAPHHVEATAGHVRTRAPRRPDTRRRVPVSAVASLHYTPVLPLRIFVQPRFVPS